MNKVYVGNLSYSTTEDGLKEEFESCGDITEVKLITDRETGRSKGFAFVTFGSDEAFEAGLAKNGQDLDGRPLRVNKAEDKPKRSNSFSSRPF